MSDRILSALCCICGSLRTCKRPRNYRRENYWLRGPIDNNWHRETGDLKCDECGRVTTHAILLPEGHWRDHAEQIHREAIGYYTKTLTPAHRKRIQQAWRQGPPRNPYLRHISWVSDEAKARAAGETHVRAICMELVPLPKRVTKPGEGVDRDVLIKPWEFEDVDYEDPETGLWWFDMRCPDCLHRSNDIAIDENRKQLVDRLLQLTVSTKDLDYRAVMKLQAVLDELGSPSKGSADV